MVKALITGGAGFIGSKLAECLSAKGYKIIVVDNLSRGKKANLSKVSEKIQFVNGNIIDYDLISGIIKEVDVVFHLASLSRVVPSIEHPSKCFENNVLGVEIIARLCTKHHKKLVFSSSREVYGTVLEKKVDESHPLNPENPYGASKVCGEKIIETYSKCYDLKYSILRFTNVYGERDFQRVIPIFIQSTLRNQPLVIYGGKQVIDFVHVSDITNILVQASDYNDNLIVNAGSGKGISIINLAKLIRKIGSGSNEIVLNEKRRGEVENFVAKIDKAERILNWSPTIELKDGLAELFERASSPNAGAQLGNQRIWP
jgi:UDP-glucose 4-epimerase